MRTEHAASARRRETYVAKAGQVERNWKIVDAEGISLGRLSADIAVVLMGKHRPEYTPHIDTGDFVIVTNASKVGLTGNKASQKLRKHYTGYPGGLKAETYGSIRDRQPEKLIEEAGPDAFDVVLLDQTMPLRPGVCLIPVVRQALPAAKVVLFTGEQADVAPGLVDGVVVKPVTIQELMDAIQDAVDA